MNQLIPTTAERRRSPTCGDCGATMTLFGIEAHPTIEGADLLTYVCSDCDAVETEAGVSANSAPMMSLLGEKAFDAEMTHLLGSAFDGAWERLESRNRVPSDKGRTASMRELLARFVIAAVEQGETDPHRVMEKALLRLKIMMRRDAGAGASV